jgi:hypothetical protein
VSHPADPPIPVPPHLRPQVAYALGPDDLRVVASTEELRVLARLLDHEGLAGSTILTHRDGSPWLEIAVAVPYHFDAPDHPPGGKAVLGGRVYQYAIWRYTAKAYRLGEDGAVEDDPIDLMGDQ